MATPQEIIDKVVFGGLYKVKSHTWPRMNQLFENNQCYLWAVPIMDDKGNLWMQDTYQLPYPSSLNGKSKTDAAIDDVCSFGPGYSGWVVKRAIGNYYYKNQRKIESEDDLDHFEFVADLHDYRGLKAGEDYRDYKSEDLIRGVKLYFEHGYSWNYGPVGVVLVRKDAEKNSKCILNKAIDDVNAALKWPRGAYNGAILRLTDALEKCVKDGDLDDKLYKKAYDALAMSDKLDEMNKEFNKFYDKLKGFNENDGESVDNCV